MSETATVSRPFGVVGTAMVTPLTADGSAVDADAVVALAHHLVDHGNDMIVVGGTTGESPTVSDEEKLEVLSLVVREVGERATIVSGVGTNDTRHSIALARAHAEAGADGLLLVTPYYSKPSQAGVIAHSTAVADATDLPVMLYDIPGRSGIPLATDTLLRLAEHPRILAVKDAKGDFEQATHVMRQTKLAYYSGEDALNYLWLALGASGMVSVVGHVAGDMERKLVEAVDAHDLDAARAVHHDLAPIVDAIMNHMPGVVAAKAALALRGVLPHATVRLPLVPATEEQTSELSRALSQASGLASLKN